jgi:hypothetical protein
VVRRPLQLLVVGDGHRRVHGWTKDKAYWLGYRVTEGILDTGVLTVPAGVVKLIGARRFELAAIDGTAMGTLAADRDGNAWGVSQFIRRRGVDTDDAIVITIDLDLEFAMVQSGSPADLLVAYAEGEGRGPQHYLEEMTAPAQEDQSDA